MYWNRPRLFLIHRHSRGSHCILHGSQCYCGWPKSISHHFETMIETMIETIICWILQGNQPWMFLRCETDFVHPQYGSASLKKRLHVLDQAICVVLQDALRVS